MANKSAVVIGGGPAGLMAAEQLLAAGVSVDVYDAMPSMGRKFLRAGIGGLNITHSEADTAFRRRFASAQSYTDQWLDAFGTEALLSWCRGLGVETFVGSSGRVFPLEKKAAPLLRRWLQRLRVQGVRLHTRHRFNGWDSSGQLLLDSPNGQIQRQADVVIFACGGGSWAKLGSDGRWLALLKAQGVACTDFLPSNCGFDFNWSSALSEQFGEPLKNIALGLTTATGEPWYRKGDALIASYGIEGSLVYAASSHIRDVISKQGQCTVYWDLFPERSVDALRSAIGKRKPKDSLSNVLRKQCRLSGSKLALLKALTSKQQMTDLASLAELLKALPQSLGSARPLDEAISTAGGVTLSQLNEQLMLKNMPGVFCAGEMLDWDAPTGGYLLTACFASGFVAGRGAASYFLADAVTLSS